MRFITGFLLLFMTSSLGACGGLDGVDVTLPFVGKISSDSKAEEKTMATRGTLLLPPSVQGLPVPTEKTQTANSQSWPSDPDQIAKSDAKVAALKEENYRKNGDWSGQKSTGNGLEDFKNKTDWQRRQKGIFQDGILKQD